MPVSQLTALIIASRDDIEITSAGPNKQGMYVGWITLGEADRFRPLLTSAPIYRSHDEAKEAMERVVEVIRKKEERGNTTPTPVEPIEQPVPKPLSFGISW